MNGDRKRLILTALAVVVGLVVFFPYLIFWFLNAMPPISRASGCGSPSTPVLSSGTCWRLTESFIRRTDSGSFMEWCVSPTYF